MARVSVSKTLQVQAYEPIKLEVEFTSDDFPGVEALPGVQQAAYLYYRAYKLLGAFQIQHGVNPQTVHEDVANVKRLYKIGEVEEILAAQIAAMTSDEQVWAERDG